MERMSPLDAGFLELEDEDLRASLAIASIAVLEGPPPSYEEFAASLTARLPLIARYRQKIRQVPLDLGPPVWVDDPQFDLAYHIRRTALPVPGADEQLYGLVGRVMTQRLDRERPLWECWLVEGLHGGRWAVLTKVHHCMVDGVSGVNLFRVLFDATARPPARLAGDDRSPPPAQPSTVWLTAAAVGELALLPLEYARALGGALRAVGLGPTLRCAAQTARGVFALAGAVLPARATSLSGPVGRPRQYRAARASLADVNAVRAQFGGTVNDVVLTAVASAFRRLLLARGEQPTRHALRSLVPVNVRSAGQENVYDNRISLLLADLPVEIADPVRRLRAVRARVDSLKASGEALAGKALTSLAVYVPFPLVSGVVRLLLRVPRQRIVTTVTTNVPGPSQPLYACGRRVVEILPYVPIATTLRFGVAIFSYCGQLTFGVSADRDHTADIDVLTLGIEDSLAELLEAARHARGGTGNTVHAR